MGGASKSAETPVTLASGPQDAPCTIVLAHGAGAGIDTPYMNAFADGLAGEGCHVVRFEFPYMTKRRERGTKNPPDREPVLRETWQRVIDALETKKFVMGGKSLGGRIASLMADEAGAAGLVCLGYPFHPTGKPDQLRIEHLQTLETPTLILQGERDPFGSREEVGQYELSPAIRLHWLPDGDHSFKPRKSSGRTAEENWQEGVRAMVQFLDELW